MSPVAGVPGRPPSRRSVALKVKVADVSGVGLAGPEWMVVSGGVRSLRVLSGGGLPGSQ